MKEELSLKNIDEIEINEEDAKFMLSEPITWSWIAIEIGKGVLAEIGAKIFGSIFSKGVNIEQLIRNMLREIDKIVTLRIDEAFISDAIDKAKTTDYYLRQYLNSPTKERLHLIYENSAYLVNRFERFNHKTFNEYILAVSFQLVALEEMYLTLPGEKNNIIELLTKGKSHILKLNDEWRAISDRRFKIKVMRFPSINGTSRVPAYYVAEGDKRLTELSPDKKRIEKELERIKDQRYNSDVVEIYINHSIQIIKLWDKRISQLNGTGASIR